VGIFFTSSKPLLPEIRKSIEDALRVNPQTLVNPQQEAADIAIQLNQCSVQMRGSGRTPNGRLRRLAQRTQRATRDGGTVLTVCCAPSPTWLATIVLRS
jgi:hypothetical protein